MTPTNELRFVEREVITEYGCQGAHVAKTIRVLQQKWVQTYGSTDESGTFFTAEEWRDVPLVKEALE